MACKTCKRLQAMAMDSASYAPRAQAPIGELDVTDGLPYGLVPGTQYIGTSKMRRITVTSCAVPTMRTPRGGWGINILIKGQSHPIAGLKPRDVYTDVAELLTVNEIPFIDVDLWLNLNLEWVSRAVMRYQKITTEDLMKVAISNHA